MRIFKYLSVVACFAGAMALGCGSAEPMNVVFILVDDLGWNDLSSTGSRLHHTPNLDRLGGEGISFTQAYASCPVCSPTRASILTGKYPTTVGITDWIPGRDPKDRKLLGTEDAHELSSDETTFPEVLQKEGYRTFFAGKWHLGEEGSWPEDHGFDMNFGGHHRGSPPGGYYAPYDNPALSDGPEGEYLPERLTNESISFLEEHGESPFLLYLSFYTVHTPIQASLAHVQEAEARASRLGIDTLPQIVTEQEGHTVLNQYNTDYASMVDAMDENVGRLLESLHRLGLDDNTMIVFTSDNGGLSTLLRSWGAAPTSVRPLRGGKGWCYEGGIRVPLILRMPGQAEAQVIDAPVSSIDFYPTILDALDLEVPEGQIVDGESLLPLLTDASLKRDAIFWHYPHYHGSAWTPAAAIRMDKWKLIEFYDPEKVELYDLSSDVGEENDLSVARPAVTARLLDRLHEMQEETGAQFPKANPDYNDEGK